MKEIKEILNRVSALTADKRAVLATVIDVRGSGYRLPGARMLILENGHHFGTVSGGCLEADVLERAKKVLATGDPDLFTYDTTGDENSVFSMNMGCRGVIRILLEPVTRESPIIQRLSKASKDRSREVLATCIAAPAGSGSKIGSRKWLGDTGTTAGDDLMDALSQFAASGCSYEMAQLDTSGGMLEYAFEAIEPPTALLVFGAGADAVPLSNLAAELGWHVAVHDHRPAYLTNLRFPTAEKLALQLADEPPDLSYTDARTAGVVMTHNYGRDRLILPALLSSNVFYVGALGPKTRTEQLLREIDGELTDQQLSRLYAPIGLDIGAATPETIALSIVAEIQSVLADRDGGHLRSRRGSIYDRK